MEEEIENMEIYRDEKVIESIYEKGEKIEEGIKEDIEGNRIKDNVRI